MLLEYGGGCQKGAKHFGLMKYVDAVAFCVQMRKHMANYCLCDLACWLCLAAPDKKKGMQAQTPILSRALFTFLLWSPLSV